MSVDILGWKQVIYPIGLCWITKKLVSTASQFPLMRVLLITVSAVIVAICLFRIFTEVTQMVSNSREYFTDLLNYAELFLYFSTISFVCNGDFMCLTGWRWQLGALCVFLSWLNFVFFLRLQPKFGIYVLMFEEIIATFLKVLPLAVLLIMAFGQPFFILLGPIVIESDVSNVGSYLVALSSFTLTNS